MSLVGSKMVGGPRDGGSVGETIMGHQLMGHVRTFMAQQQQVIAILRAEKQLGIGLVIASLRGTEAGQEG